MPICAACARRNGDPLPPARIVADALIENGVPNRRLRIDHRGPTPGFESLESRRVEVR